MASYWRLKDIPGLRDVPRSRRRRRRLWREAGRRSFTWGRWLASLAVYGAVMQASDAASASWLPTHSRLWLEMLALPVTGFAIDCWIWQPVACRWLREHAHELERYVPA